MTSTHRTSPPNQTKATLPALDIRAPLVAGIAAAIMFSVVCFGVAAVTNVQTGIALSGKVIGGGKPEIVRHAGGGTVAEVKVIEGQSVSTGDVLLTFDTTFIDQQIGALKAQSEAATHQLEVLGAEVSTATDLFSRKLATAQHLKDLERKVAEARDEASRLSAQITAASAELEKAVVRAPAGGRVVSLAASSRGAMLMPGTPVAEIEPASDRTTIGVRLSPEEAAKTRLGMPAKVSFALQGMTGRDAAPAVLVWQSPDRTAGKRNGEASYAARIELDGPPADAGRTRRIPLNSRADVMLVTGQQKLLAYLLKPDFSPTEMQP